MKTVLYKVLFIFILPIVFTHCEKEPDPITIPDDNFLKALIELGVDTNGDGVISPAEAAIITTLDVGGKNISDITGIEAFINLDTLWCSGNKLTSLDVSNNSALEKLRCSHNQLTSLDVSNNAALVTLGLSSMPTLYEVCVWEMPFPPILVAVFTDGSPNVYYTTECTGGK